MVAVFGFIYAEEIVALFRDDADVIVVGATAFRWQLLTYPLGAVVMYSNMMMQTIRKPIRASILSAARQGIFFIPAILIMPQLFGIQGVEAVKGRRGKYSRIKLNAIILCCGEHYEPSTLQELINVCKTLKEKYGEIKD